MTYYGQGLSDVARGLESIAKAITTISKVQSAPITYNIIVNVDPDTDKAEIAKAVAESIERADAKRTAQGRNY